MAHVRLNGLACVAAVMLGAGCAANHASPQCCAMGDAKKPTTAPIAAAPPAPAQAPVGEAPLRVDQFEDHQLKMADVSSHQLIVFLRDLNHRRDNDYAQHGDEPGPDHEYLTLWIQRTSAELAHRGYSFDAVGELHAPDNAIVPTR